MLGCIEAGVGFGYLKGEVSIYEGFSRSKCGGAIVLCTKRDFQYPHYDLVVWVQRSPIERIID